MKNGFKIWDTDTHVRPTLETLEPFYDAALRARLPEFEQYRRISTREIEGQVPGRSIYAFPEQEPFRRVLGKAERESSRPPTQYRGKYPHRLKAALPIVPRAIDASLAEIKQWGKTSWAVGVYPNMENGTPLDHPDMEPIWAAVDELGLAVIHHSHYNGPPYFPGYLDIWDNAFLGRS